MERMILNRNRARLADMHVVTAARWGGWGVIGFQDQWDHSCWKHCGAEAGTPAWISPVVGG